MKFYIHLEVKVVSNRLSCSNWTTFLSTVYSRLFLNDSLHPMFSAFNDGPGRHEFSPAFTPTESAAVAAVAAAPPTERPKDESPYMLRGSPSISIPIISRYMATGEGGGGGGGREGGGGNPDDVNRNN